MQGYKVLIVDDSPFMRKVFSDVIDADAAFNVLTTASNGKEAVDLALKLKPDIITMDLEMPQMNGIEALQRIMAIQPTPIIMLSAVTDNGTRDTIKALQYGAIDFIRKPDGAVKLDIRQVGEQLLEKLHIALETMSSGAFRMLPAVEEKNDPSFPLAPVQAMQTTAMQDEVEKPDNPAETLSHKPLTESKRSVVTPAKPKNLDIARKLDNIAEIPKPIGSPPALSLSDTGGGLLKSIPKSSLPEVGKQGKAHASRLNEIKPIPVHLNNGNVTTQPSKAEVNSEKPVKAFPTSTFASQASTTFTQIVVMGTSTGGPRALHEVLTGIPADFPAPILVVQHMPPKFTHSLAQRLDNFCNIQVREAVDGEVIETATAYIAPGGRHMTLGKKANGKYRIILSDEGPRGGHMPSVDVTFESLLGQQQLKRHVVLMTGMGSDGAKGMKALQMDGAVTTIAEAEQTCVVYGMPRSAVELGAASHVIPLQTIASVLVQEVKFSKS